MGKTRLAIAVMAVLLTLPACGTIIARCGRHGADIGFGFPVYNGTAENINWTVYLAVKSNPAWLAVGLVSLPFDLVLDTVFLLPDLTAGLLGQNLRPPPTPPEEPQADPGDSHPSSSSPTSATTPESTRKTSWPRRSESPNAP